MKSQLKIFCLLLLSVNVFSQTTSAVYEGPFEDIKMAAQRSNRLIFIDFSSETCATCVKMNKQIYSDKTISEKLNTYFLVYKISHDEPEGKALTKKFKIEEYPAFLILDAKENVSATIKGMHTNKAFYKKLEKIKPNTVEINKSKPITTPKPQVKTETNEPTEKSLKTSKKDKKQKEEKAKVEPKPAAETIKTKKKKALFF